MDKTKKYLKRLPKIVDEEAWQEYRAFINNCQEFPSESETYCEDHHVIPRGYLAPEEKLDPENIIRITARDHFKAHSLLWKALQDTNMTCAYWRMAHSEQNGSLKWINADEFQSLREAFKARMKTTMSDMKWIHKGTVNKRVPSAALSDYLEHGWIQGRPPATEETRKHWSEAQRKRWDSEEGLKIRELKSENLRGDKNWFYGKKHSEESLKKMRIKNGIQTEARIRAHKENGDKNRGKILLHTLEGKQSRVKKEDVASYIENGWILGGIKTKDPNNRKTTVNDGIHEKIIFKKDLQDYLDQGYKKGRLPITEEHLKHLRESKKRITDDKSKE